MKIVEQGLYIHGKGREQGYFLKILASSCWRLKLQENGFANAQWSLVLWSRQKTLYYIINQSNRVSSHVLVVWQKNKNHALFPRIVNQLFEAWIVGKHFRASRWSRLKSEREQYKNEGALSHFLILYLLFSRLCQRRTQTHPKSLKKPLLRQKDDYTPQVR